MSREQLVQQISVFLGNAFEYFYDSDQLQNQMKPESDCKFIHFKFKPDSHMSQNEIKTIFDTKLKNLQQNFLQHEVTGGKAMWFGYILTIKINTVEDLTNEMARVQLEYEQKITQFQEQLEILRSTCGV